MRRLIFSFLTSIILSTILIHLDYRPLYKFFQLMRKEFNHLTGRPIVRVIWDEKRNIPLVDYDNFFGYKVGLRFNPLTMSQVMLEFVLPHDTAQFLEMAYKFLKYVPEDGLFKANFPAPFYGMGTGFRSAFSQSAAALVFLKAWKISGDTTFLQISRKLLKYLFIPVDEGGTIIKKGDAIWLLEYANPGGPYPRVLNGMMWSILHIRECASMLNDSSLYNLYKVCERTLRDSLPEYDLGGWTYYDRYGRVSGELYQMMHVDLLDKFYEITGSEFYKKWSKRWKTGFHIPYRARIAWGWYLIHILLLGFLFNLRGLKILKHRVNNYRRDLRTLK